MTDIRRTVLWVVFAFSLIMLWDKWQIHNGKPATFFPSATPAQIASQQNPQSTQNLQSVQGEQQNVQNVQNAQQPSTEAEVAPSEQITITTDVLRVVVDTQGGSIVSTELLQYKNQRDDPSPVMLLQDGAEHTYIAQSGLIGGNYPTHKTLMHAQPGQRSLEEGQESISLRLESPEMDGIKLVKTLTFKRGSYVVDVEHEVVNVASSAIAQEAAPKLYVQLLRDGKPVEGGTAFYSTFTGPAVYTEASKYQKVEFKDIDKGKVDFEKNSDNGYVAMVQHYFASAWLLGAGVERENFVRKVDSQFYSAGSITPLGAEVLEPGQSVRLNARFFSGPQLEKSMESVAPGLELVKDYGMFTILSKPLYWLLDKIHSVLGNWGWSIVGLVLLLKIAFYWLNAKAYSSMAKMKAINPRIQEMRERLKDKPQQMQQEMMRIYREEKVNPLGGCLPIMVQIPVFIALYWVLLSSVEIRQAPWIGWVTDLSAKDPLFILPILMALSSLLQVALNPVPPDPMQAKLMWLMPIMFSFMFFMFPAGLVLYWLTNNILSIAQQWMINTRMGVPPQFNHPFKK